MFFLYNTLLYALTILLAPIICILLIVRRKYRSGFLEKCALKPLKLPGAVRQKRPIWIHAVSVGEVMAAIPFMKELKKRYAHIPIVLSTVTETGHFTALQNADTADYIFYFPFDFPPVVRSVISRIQPRVFVTLEGEIWPNLLRNLKHRNIPSMIISGRVSAQSFKNYCTFRFFFRRVLGLLDHCSMQTGPDAERIIAIGAPADRVTVSGSIKFDQPAPSISPEEQNQLRQTLTIQNGSPVLIAGSTHRGEEEIVLAVYRKLKADIPELKMVLAPRHPERFNEVAEILKTGAAAFARKTELPPAPGRPAPDIILLDTIGDLSKLYSIATVVFIGGSFVPVGGHNVLEPAVFNKPVLFGPNMANFHEIATILQQKKAAIQVNDADACYRRIRDLLKSPQLQQQIGDNAARAIKANSGALAKNIALLENLLNSPRT